MKYFKNKDTNEVFAYDETYKNDTSYIQRAIDNGWEDITNNWPPAMPVIDIAAHALAVCKTTAKKKLLDTDYTQLADVLPTLANKAEFDEYRTAVRGLYLNPVESPNWPTEPTPNWLKK